MVLLPVVIILVLLTIEGREVPAPVEDAAQRGRRLPLVLSQDEVKAILAELNGRCRIMINLICGGGLRLNEAVQLRVKDIDIAAGSVTVGSAKGDKDRVTLLPRRLEADLRQHLQSVKAMHQQDLAAGAGEAPLPNALWRKYPAWAKYSTAPQLSQCVEIRDVRPRRSEVYAKTHRCAARQNYVTFLPKPGLLNPSEATDDALRSSRFPSS